jgi:tripartite-type tricarboxylate transporter receptor subunit TctC
MKKFLGILIFTMCHSIWAQNLTVVSGSSPGAGVDTVTRKVIKRYDELYGTTSVVMNRTGAEGKIALNHLKELPANQPKMLATSQGHVLNYDAQDFESLVPLALVTSQPCILIVRRDFPANTWDEFVDYAVKNPGKVSMGVAARAAIYPWLMPILERNRMTMNMIMQGSQDLHFTVASGDLDSFWSNPASFVGRGFEGRVKVIAVTGTDPIPGIDPKLLGGNNPRLGTVLPVQGFYTTNDVTPELRKLMSDRLQSILNSKWAQENLSNGGIIKVGGTPEQLMQTARRDWTEWQKHKNTK